MLRKLPAVVFVEIVIEVRVWDVMSRLPAAPLQCIVPGHLPANWGRGKPNMTIPFALSHSGSIGAYRLAVRIPTVHPI
jgi:hypothetical protein